LKKNRRDLNSPTLRPSFPDPPAEHTGVGPGKLLSLEVLHARQTQHCLRTWPVGRRILFQQGHRAAGRRRLRSDRDAKPFEHGRRRRRCGADVAEPRARSGRASRTFLYGGTVITASGTDHRVKALVYICALAPEDGDTTQADQTKFPQTPVFQHIEVADGRLFLRPSGIPEFAGDLPEAEQKLVWATQMGPVADLFGQPVPGAAWKTKPTYYIVGTEDRTVQPDLQRFLAKRMNAKVTELGSSHVPMLSQPRRVYEVIREAADGVQQSAG